MTGADKNNLKYTGNVFTPRFATTLTSATLNQPLWLNLNYAPPPVFTNPSTFPQYQVSEQVRAQVSGGGRPGRRCGSPGASFTNSRGLISYFLHRGPIRPTARYACACISHTHTRTHTHTHTHTHVCLFLIFLCLDSGSLCAVSFRAAWLILGCEVPGLPGKPDPWHSPCFPPPPGACFVVG